MYRMKNLSTVVPAPALIADAYNDVLKNDELDLVFERLALNPLGANGTFAVFTSVVVH